MSFSNKIDARMLSILLVALIGGVIGGYISNATVKDSQIEGLSNALTTQLISKDTEIATLRDMVSTLEMQVIDLNTSIVGFNTPDYDSGWITFNYQEGMFAHSWIHVQHNLDTTDIYVICLKRQNTMYEGYLSYQSDFIWSCDDENEITITYDGPAVYEVRALIYKLPPS